MNKDIRERQLWKVSNLENILNIKYRQIFLFVEKCLPRFNGVLTRHFKVINIIPSVRI